MGKKKEYRKCNGFPLNKPIDHAQYMRYYRAQDTGRVLRRVGLLDEKTIKKMSRALLFAWLCVFSWFILTPSYSVKVVRFLTYF